MTSAKPSGPELRRHPRHATDVPVSFTLGEVVASESAYLNNIGDSGAAFNAMVELQPGTVLMMHFPPGKPVLRTPARVVWCRPMAFQFVVGVEFLNQDPVFKRQLLVVVQAIDNYRGEAMRSGRELNAQQATLEWIGLYAEDFFRNPA